MEALIEGAYMAGFEPSRDGLTDEELLTEAENYLISTQYK